MNPANRLQKEKMVSCSSCGAENREGAEFCDSCGTKLTNGAFVPAVKWWMYFDYTSRALIGGLLSILIGVVLITFGQPLLSIFFFGIGMLGLAFAYMMIGNKKSFIGGPDPTIPTADEATDIESDFGKGLG